MPEYGKARLGLGFELIKFRILSVMEWTSLCTNTMRYYEQKYPEVDELVMVQVRQIAEMGAYVKLVRLLCYLLVTTCRLAL